MSCRLEILFVFLFYTCFSSAISAQQERFDLDTFWLSPKYDQNLNGGEACYALIAKELELGSIQSKGSAAKGKIEGVVSYEFLYRSQVDTPFQQQDFQQHIIRAAFKANILNKWPVNINVAYKASNSPYFRNTFDVDIGFDPQSFKKKLESQVVEKSRQILEAKYHLPDFENQYRQKLTDVAYWNRSASTPDFSKYQQEAGTKITNKIFDKIQLADSSVVIQRFQVCLQDYLKGKDIDEVARVVRKNSKLSEEKICEILEKHSKEIGEWQKLSKKREEVTKEAKDLYDKIQRIKKLVSDSVSILRSEVANINNGKDLDKVMKKAGISKDSVSKAQRVLSSLRSLHIGRSIVNFSELTVKNVSVTGINASVSPGPFIAIAAGYIDYRFRDFVFRNATMPRQAALMGRIGLSGSSDKGLFLTAYTGKREIIGVTGNNANTYFQLSGFSVEYIFPINKQNVLTAELAKSNAPAYRGGTKESGKMIDFGQRSNEAYSIRYSGLINVTHTQIKAFYRKLGSDFQSFSLYTYNSNQSSYGLTIDQAFYQKQLLVKAGIRKNEFVYPYLTNLSSNAIFKTAQLTLKKRKWPVITAGYYPSTQIVIMPDKDASQIIYQTLSFSASHQYKLFGLPNSSMLICSKFYNQSSDTSFLYFNATYWGYQHFLWKGPFTIQAGYTFTKQDLVAVQTLESSLSWNHPKGLVLTAGIKRNVISSQNNLWGGTARMQMPIKKLGCIQLTYDLSSLPVWQERKLLPVSMGRLIYTKTI